MIFDSRKKKKGNSKIKKNSSSSSPPLISSHISSSGSSSIQISDPNPCYYQLISKSHSPLKNSIVNDPALHQFKQTRTPGAMMILRIAGS